MAIRFLKAFRRITKSYTYTNNVVRLLAINKAFFNPIIFIASANIASTNMRIRNIYLALILTVFITGTMDAAATLLLNSKVPVAQVFSFIASGVFGKSAFVMSSKMVAYGIIFHYMISYVFTTTWFVSFPLFTRLFRNKYVIGVLYGLFTWLIMSFIVIPLSHTPKGKHGMTLMGAGIGMATLVLCIGLPTALMASNYYKEVRKPAKLGRNKSLL